MPEMSVRYKLFDSYDSYLNLYLYRELVNALSLQRSIDRAVVCGANTIEF
jgi:hypothetical protein